MGILVTGSAGHPGETLMRSFDADHHVVGIDVLDTPFTNKIGSIMDPSRDVTHPSRCV